MCAKVTSQYPTIETGENFHVLEKVLGNYITTELDPSDLSFFYYVTAWCC